MEFFFFFYYHLCPAGHGCTKTATKTAVCIGTRGQGGSAAWLAELGRQLIGVGIARDIYE